MASKRFYLLKILLRFIKINYQKALEYRADFIFSFIATSCYSFGYISFLWVVLAQVPSVNGWNFDKMLTLFGVNQIMIYLSWAFFRYSLSNIHYLIRTGNFDSILKLPLNARFTLSFRDHSTDLPLPLLMALGIFWYSMRNTQVEFTNILLFLLLFICGFIILYNMLFIFVTFSFWVIEGQDLTTFFEESFSYARYPLSVFPSGLAFLFLTVIPISLMNFVPTSALLGMLDWRLAIWSVVMVFVTWFVSQKIWHAGLRHYSSASS